MSGKRADQIKKEILELKASLETHSFRKDYGQTEHRIYQLQLKIKNLDRWIHEDLINYQASAKLDDSEKLNENDRFESILVAGLQYKDIQLDDIYEEYAKYYVEQIKLEKEFVNNIAKKLKTHLKEETKTMDKFKVQIKEIHDKVHVLEKELEDVKETRKKNLELLISGGNLEDLLEGGYEGELKDLGLLDNNETEDED